MRTLLSAHSASCLSKPVCKIEVLPPISRGTSVPTLYFRDENRKIEVLTNRELATAKSHTLPPYDDEVSEDTGARRPYSWRSVRGMRFK